MSSTVPRKRHPLRALWIGLFLILAITLTAGVLWARRRFVPVSYEASRYKETADILSNPWQGFYQLCGYYLKDENGNLESGIASHMAASRGDALVLIQINLGNYRSAPLSDKALQQLDTILSSWSGTDTGLILRFLYDWDGKGLESEPESIDLIKEHMSQVAPIVNRYAEHIYILQGIFVGNWGEMNNSAYLGHEAMTGLMNHLADLTDPSIFLSVRTPAQWRTIVDAADLPDPFPAFDGSLVSRLGLYNDGMLGSVTDTGTYGDTSRSGSDTPGDKGTREEELAFQEGLCRYVPNGGEVIIENPYNDLEAAIADLSQMHVSYLNKNYDPKVLDKWKDSVYTGDGCFYGCSGFDYIRAHLGYRYVLRDSSLAFDTWRDDTASLSLTLENVGFASSLKALTLWVTVQDCATGELHAFPLADDLRFLSGGSAMTCHLDLPVRSIPAGTYDLYLSLQDVQTRQTVLLGNSGLTEYGYPLGQLVIGADSPGIADLTDFLRTRWQSVSPHRPAA